MSKSFNVVKRVLYDIRDNNSYTIRKLADGNCWMTQDLRLSLATGTSVVASYNDGTTFAYTPTNNASIGTYSLVPASNGVYYYTWNAATAEQGVSAGNNVDVDGSICPKGWKLPYVYTYEKSTLGSKYSWGALSNAYGITIDAGVNTNSSQFLVVESVPISLVRNGYIEVARNIANSGVTGVRWSSTVGPFAFTFYVRSDGVQAFHPVAGENGVYTKNARGFNVRCLASHLAH